MASVSTEESTAGEAGEALREVVVSYPSRLGSTIPILTDHARSFVEYDVSDPFIVVTFHDP